MAAELETIDSISYAFFEWDTELKHKFLEVCCVHERVYVKCFNQATPTSHPGHNHEIL